MVTYAMKAAEAIAERPARRLKGRRDETIQFRICPSPSEAKAQGRRFPRYPVARRQFEKVLIEVTAGKPVDVFERVFGG